MNANDAKLAGRGIEAAGKFLARRGYDVIATDWTSPAGGIDVVAREDDTLVFVEVRTRRSDGEGFPATACSASMRGRFERVALAFLAEYAETDLAVRFDIIDIIVIDDDRALLRHHLAAASAA